MSWEEFQKDNPFKLNYEQYKRIQRYIEPMPVMVKVNESLDKKYFWKCDVCGVQGRGAAKRKYANESMRQHERTHKHTDAHRIRIWKVK